MIAKERYEMATTEKKISISTVLIDEMLNYFSKSETNKRILKSLLNDAENKNFGKFSLRLYLCATERHSQASPMRYRIIELSLSRTLMKPL